MKDHIHRMIRVDQAGEFGATRIYAGQLAVMGDRGPHSGEIAAMAQRAQVKHLLLTHIRAHMDQDHHHAAMLADASAAFDGEVGIAEDLLRVSL